MFYMGPGKILSESPKVPDFHFLILILTRRNQKWSGQRLDRLGPLAKLRGARVAPKRAVLLDYNHWPSPFLEIVSIVLWDLGWRIRLNIAPSSLKTRTSIRRISDQGSLSIFPAQCESSFFSKLVLPKITGRPRLVHFATSCGLFMNPTLV